VPPLIAPACLRSVHLMEREHFERFWMSICYDPVAAALRPNLTLVTSDGSVILETNEVGLTGEPLDPSRGLAVVWGDSVVFCGGRSWSMLLGELAPQHQVLNGGIEYDPYDNILRRAAALNGRCRVALNIVMLGWHRFTPSWWKRPGREARMASHGDAGNAGLRDKLRVFLRRHPNTVMLTTPTALNADLISVPMSTYAVAGHADMAFVFFGDREREVQGQREAYAYILERNATTREVCAELGVRVVDLFAAFDTSGVTDFREHFYDIVHFRRRSFPLVARRIHDGIKDLLV
jgi:hypothetical protein